MNLPKIILKKNKENAVVKRFHPWIFSGAILHKDDNVTDSSLVKIYDFNNNFIGIGYYQDNNIAIRILTYNDEKINREFWKNKIEKALLLRRELGFLWSEKTNMFRLIYAEGDNIPGLIADYYDGNIVLQSHTKGIYNFIEEISLTLKELLSYKVKSIYHKSNKLGFKDFYLYGHLNEECIALENNNKFIIDWEKGQKTGFFIDQRENRYLLGKYSSDKIILNTFCYTGGFSIYALNSNAKEVHSVDSSKFAINLTDRNVLINSNPDKHKSFVCDVFEFLEKSQEHYYDIIVLDPPAFSKNIDTRHNAITAYKRLNLIALKKAKKGGIIFTFSCSQVVDKEMFFNTILSASILAKRDIKVLHQLTQPPDHPCSIFHKEAEYLKGLVLYVS